MVIVAVSGCVHGQIDSLYQKLAELEAYRGVQAAVLLCTADFQALRNDFDLHT